MCFSIHILQVYIFLKILWLRCLFPCSEHLLVSSATLSCKKQNILTLSMLPLFSVSHLCIACWSVKFIKQGFKFLAEHTVFILKFYFFMLLLNFITFKYSFFRSIIMTPVFPARYVQLVLDSFLIIISSSYCHRTDCSDCAEDFD